MLILWLNVDVDRPRHKTGIMNRCRRLCIQTNPYVVPREDSQGW